MSQKHKSGAFGSRKGIPGKAVMAQGNVLSFDPNPAPYFADFESMHAECVSLTTSAGMVLPFVQNGELLAKVNATALNVDILALNEHIRAFKGRLALIEQKRNELKESIKAVNPNNILGLFDHAEEYQSFMNDWTRVVMYAVDIVLDHFRNVGEAIPLVCPFHPSFTAPATPNQMTAEQFNEATRQPTLADMKAAE